jgi:hypothetical protein
MNLRDEIASIIIESRADGDGAFGMADRIIARFFPATGTGSMPATEKGTGSPASDTGTRGGGASLAAAPDYEAVCGSCGRPTP